MRKFITHILLVTALFIANAGACRAQELTAGSSASLQNNNKPINYDYRVENLRNFLKEYNSPLVNYAGSFVADADANGIDYRLVPAIAGVESTFGKQIPNGSYNAYGWANGDYSFTSWDNSIQVVTGTLKTQYVDKGALSVSKIARIYAPPSVTWAYKVKYFVGKIDPLPNRFDI